MNGKERVQALLAEGVRTGTFPGAVVLAAREGEIVFFEEAGFRFANQPSTAVRKDTVFDLASLTKPLATALSVMKLVDEEKIHLDQPLSELLPTAVPPDKRAVTPRLLLCHSAGFPAWRPFYLTLGAGDPASRKRALRDTLMRMPLDYPPGRRALYSDLGFMVLEWVVETAAGDSLPRHLERNVYAPLSLKRTFFDGVRSSRPVSEAEIAPTETCPWRGKTLVGVVHDENAYALGGYSGHAGLFGAAEEVYTLAQTLYQHFTGMRVDCFRPRTVQEFFKRQDIAPGSTWALGWDTPSPEGSSAGAYFSAGSVGHLGFTGVSLWMDLEQGVVAALLTNRIHPTRDNAKIRAFRPRLHDAIMEELGMGEKRLR